MPYIVTILILFLCFVINKRQNQHIGFPPTIFSAVWLFVILGHFLISKFEIIKINELTINSLTFFAFGVVLFSLGGWLSTYQKLVLVKKEAFLVSKIKTPLLILLILICLIFLKISIEESIEIMARNQITESGFANLRHASHQGDKIGLSKYGMYLSFFLTFFLFEMHMRHKKYLKYFLISLLISISFAILTTGRTSILLLFSLVSGVYILNDRLSFNKIIIGSFLFIFFYALYAVLLNKGGSIGNSLSDNISGIKESILEYFFGGVSAFDFSLNFNETLKYGRNTFRFIIAGFDQLGLIEISESSLTLKERFVNVPFRTNVYTVYKYYYDDFGGIYSVIMMFLFGFLHTSIFFRAYSKRSIPLMFFYSIMLYSVVISFFQDQFLSLLPSWIYFGMVIIFLTKIIPVVKKN